MYDRSKWYEKLLRHIQNQDKDEVLKDKYALLLQVELGLHLIEWLGLDDEPITVLWVLLSNNPLPHPRLRALDAQQRHAIANARILLPFAGRFSWEHALLTYTTIDESCRCYHVLPEKLEDQKVINLHSHDERLDIYNEALTGILLFAQRTIGAAKDDQYFFDAVTNQGKQVVMVDIDAESAEMVTIDLPWFSEARPRQSLEYSHDDFRTIAHELDNRSKQDKSTTSSSITQTPWVGLVNKMLGYRAILPDKSLTERNTVPLHIDGHAYIVGAVASGKSTIAKLIMADAALYPEKERRITLVVSDTMSALNLADEFNSLFCKPGEAPVAVPLIGRSTRGQHLQRLYRSGKYRHDHWGLRWLNPACPLQALVKSADFLSVCPGKEPCESLYIYPKGSEEQRKKYHFCPLFAICPSKQQYRDMPTACIWITTPGALGRSSIPSQLEKRKVSLTEIIYEQSDLVIFDEADTVQEWFDNLFAEEVVLTNGNNGILDVEDVETALALVPRRTQPPLKRRWVEAERHSLVSISNILSSLTDKKQGPTLRHWIERNYFTSLTLAYKLLWRLLGLPKWEDCQGQEFIEANQKLKPLIAHFDKLNQKDPLTIERPATNAQNNPVYRLALIMRLLLAAGDHTHNTAAFQECQAWILDFVPGIEQTLQRLQQELVEGKKKPLSKKKKREVGPPDPPDTLETLVWRLEFVLNVMMLDRNIRVVFYEWYNKPYVISTDLNENSLQGAPENLKDVLPIPPTGRVFGTYYSNGLEIGQDEQQKYEQPSGLSVFGYSNIGRWYTMHFHQLFSELDYKRGPNVLSLSGTSWLPHSSRWHIDFPLQGILEPPKEAQEAIKQSVFSYIPQHKLVDKSTLKKKLRGKNSQEEKNDNEKEVSVPIRISGETKKMQPIKDLMRALASNRNGKKSPLQEELEALQNKGRSEPEYWADRERLLLLVNSYDQARWAYDALRPSEAYQGEICYLARNSEGRDEVVSDIDAVVYRSDIEDFAKSDEENKRKILIAPMPAIGRGYNILNKHGKAAFGAIYFLTRPMPYPADTQALARELNRRTLDWCKRTDLPIWQEPLIYTQALALRDKAATYWREAEFRTYYTRLRHTDTYNDKQYAESERFDIAATTVGYVIQACGRLLRGGVPFHAFFVDAAWAPKIAHKETKAEGSHTSLLTAMFEVLQLYVQDQTGSALYAPIVEALNGIDGFEPDIPKI